MTHVVYKALLVGNGVFPEDPHNLPELNGPRNDLRALEEALTHTEVGLHKAPNVKSLLDCTRSEIMEVAEAFFADSKRDDQLLFYYSGHGRLDKYNTLYLCAQDTKTNALIATGIGDAQINAMIRLSVSRRLVVVLDCCHSGRFKGADLPQNLLGEGRFVLSSARAKELAEDTPDPDRPSAFTRHFVKALLSGEADTNQDDFVSINEVYDYILPRLVEETKQIPQRHYDHAIGELPIGRSVVGLTRRSSPRVATASSSSPGAPNQPILAVSTDHITITDVEPGEELAEEIIDVFNQGSGTLEWTVECNDNWITVERSKGFFKVRLSPKPGANRGRIYVRDPGGGGTKLIPVNVRVAGSREQPSLTVSPTHLEFGTVSRDAPAPSQAFRVVNAGGGKLNANAKPLNEWITVNQAGDLVEVRLNPSRTGEHSGQVLVESDGGSLTLPVTAHVEAGPVLVVDTKRLSFGRVLPGRRASKTVTVSNGGAGKLDWTHQTHGDFFGVERTSRGLRVNLSDKIGRHRGSIFISSNGGRVTVDVSAKVMPELTKVLAQRNLSTRMRHVLREFTVRPPRAVMPRSRG